MITDHSFEKILLAFRYNKLENLWWITESWDLYEFPKTVSENFHLRVELFCYVLERVLECNLAILYKNGAFLNRTSQDLAKMFQDAFPKNETDWLDYWWYLDDCPASIVWYADNDNGGVLTSPVGDGRFYYWP